MALTAMAVALALGGCVTDEPTPKPTPDVSETPLFATDEEALAAAEAAYARYVEVTDQIFEEGGVGLERLETVATGKQLETDRESLRELTEKGYRSVGETKFSLVELQQAGSANQADSPSVVVYLCEDVSAVDVVDSAGVSVVQPNRPSRVQFEVAFTGGRDNLLISERTPWDESC